MRSLSWLALKKASTPGHRGHPVLGLSLSGRCLSFLALHSSTAAQISESSHSSPPDTCQGAIRAHPPCSGVHSMGCVWSLQHGVRVEPGDRERARRDKGDLPRRLHVSGVRETKASACIGGAVGTGQTLVVSISRELTWTPLASALTSGSGLSLSTTSPTPLPHRQLPASNPALSPEALGIHSLYRKAST